MSAKRGHVRGSVDPTGGALITYSAVVIVGPVGTQPKWTFNVANPGSINGRYWYWQSVNGAGYTRVGTSTGNPLGNVASIAIGAVINAADLLLSYVEARDNQGELLGRSFPPTVTQF